MIKTIQQALPRGPHEWDYRPLPDAYGPRWDETQVAIPWNLSYISGAQILVTEIPGVRRKNYAFARHLGQWIADGRRDNVDFGGKRFETELADLIDELLLELDGEETIKAIRHRDKRNEVCRRLCRAEAEITYITAQKLDYSKVIKLRRFEDITKTEREQYACHHIFPVQKNPELANEPRNIVCVSRAVHARIHRIYLIMFKDLQALCNKHCPPYDWKAIACSYGVCASAGLPEDEHMMESLTSRVWEDVFYRWLHSRIPVYFVRAILQKHRLDGWVRSDDDIVCALCAYAQCLGPEILGNF